MVAVAAAAAAAAVIGVAAVVRNSVSDSSRCSVYARCLPSALATFLDPSIVFEYLLVCSNNTSVFYSKLVNAYPYMLDALLQVTIQIHTD